MLQSWQLWQTHWGENDVSVSWDSCNKVPQIRWVKTTEMYYLTILDDKIWNEGATMTMLPLKALGKKQSHAFLLASGSWLEIFGIAWLTAA